METLELNNDELKALGKRLGAGVKTEEELVNLTATLRKAMIEAALGAEMAEHLGYEKHSVDGNGTGNSRNGTSKKILKGDHGEVEIDIPRDRTGAFEPQIIKKGQTRLSVLDDQILALYARGMSTRDIVATLKEVYDADVSPALVSKVTDRVLEQVQLWQSRELDPLYPIVYLDCIVLKIRENQRVIKRSMYVALGVNLEGRRSFWVCGWQTPKVQNSGFPCSLS